MASIADILMSQGRHQAESRRARAGAWVPLVQHLANLPGQFMADRQAERAEQESAFDREQQRAARDQQLRKGERDEEAAEATAEQKRQMRKVVAAPGVIGDDGRFDIQAAQRIAAEQGYEDVLPDVFTFGQEWNEGVEKGLLTAEQIAAAKRSHQPQPTKLEAFDPTRDLRDPVTGELKVKGTPEVKPETRALNIQLADAMKNGRMAEASVIRRAIREAAAAGREPQKPEDPLALRERQLRVAKLELDLQKAPNAPTTNEKLEAVAPVLDEIQTLSDKIFTSDAGPITNIVGAWKTAAGAANLNNDVREYRSLVRGFTPLMARAVGHTGVLTEQDVERTELLFGTIGVMGTDNKTVATNKLNRMKRIMVGGGTEAEKAEIRRAMGWGSTSAAPPQTTNPASPKKQTIGRFEVQVD